MMVLGIDSDRWESIDRHVASAWAIQAEAKPRQNAVNAPLPPARVAKLRDFWAARSFGEIDLAFAAGPVPAPVP